MDSNTVTLAVEAIQIGGAGVRDLLETIVRSRNCSGRGIRSKQTPLRTARSDECFVSVVNRIHSAPKLR